MKDYYPKRIAGISRYTVRPPHARQAPPKYQHLPLQR